MRYEHTLGVSYTCMALAMRYSANLDQAEMAGLLHDCASAMMMRLSSANARSMALN
ncbi:MAG: HD domain-containing protein [Clostridium fessum]